MRSPACFVMLVSALFALPARATAQSAAVSVSPPATVGQNLVEGLQNTAVGINALKHDVVAAEQGAERIAYDFSAMYEALNPSIVKIHTDSGSGSGFLVRDDGLIATNHHVVRNSRYFAVEFAIGRKVKAEVVGLDPRRDLALLKVNRNVVSGLSPLSLLPQDADQTIKAGVPVVAFGSPLSQTFLITQGIVSKVEEGVLLGDFLIEPGNSGGPLVNLSGQVVGINTFRQRQIAGAVRVTVLRDLLAKADFLALDTTEPDDAAMPMPSRDGFPVELLKTKIVMEPLDEKAYVLDAGKFTITGLTPVLVGKIQVQGDLQQASNRYNRRAKKIKNERYDPVDEPFYEWLRNAQPYLENVVTFEIKPDFGQTAGSAWASALSAAAAGMNHRPAPITHTTMEFKAEFQDFRAYVDGKFIEPITPGRKITEQSLESSLLTFVDEAYTGMYQYLPEAFLTGKQYRFDVFDAREPGRVHRSIVVNDDSKFIQQIRRDFAEAIKK